MGYATAGTDTGHRGDGLDGSWAYRNLERQVNFGYLAVHRTAEVAKAIIAAHYGRPAETSYFQGCSRGGGQALMAAQRFPRDFDGIVAGAPAYDWTGFAATSVRNMQALYPDPSRLDAQALLAGGSHVDRVARRRRPATRTTASQTASSTIHGRAASTWGRCR